MYNKNVWHIVTYAVKCLFSPPLSSNLIAMHYLHPESSTCQSPDLGENLRGPAADRAKGQRTRESGGQSLGLLKARQECLPQEHCGHADKHHRNL